LLSQGSFRFDPSTSLDCTQKLIVKFKILLNF
jgi:hypothetical protein